MPNAVERAARPEPGSSDWDGLLELDRRRVWHPYGRMPASQPPLPVVSAQGVRLRLADGRELVDGMASWWCAIHGHRHPVLVAALHEQVDRMPHVMFGGLTHEGAVRLADRLADWTGLDHVFFADSGSVAVEVAIKLALQCAPPGRRRLLTVRGGYHGDTFGAMAVCDPVGGMHSLFTGALAEHVFADRPPDGFGAGLDEAWAAQVRAVFARHADELAAVIVEPVVQGAGGMRFHSPACVRLLRELCDEHGLLLILDEIATGFGRTGALFAAEHAGVVPDVMCVGKALTGGCITLAATLCTAQVAERLRGPLMHGPTYMANPLACAAGLASTGLLADGAWRDDVRRIEARLAAGLAPARELPGVADVRVLGAIGVVELERPVDVGAVTRAAIARGVWLRPFRDLIYAMPPYVTDDEDVARIAAAMVAGAAA
jgi:adenosylmethionine---8-amino-7-oxononanoate aminotransferase